MSAAQTILIVCYCPRCDYFIRSTVAADAIGSHGCTQCGQWMEVYVARGSREAVAWHRPSSGTPITPILTTDERGRR